MMMKHNPTVINSVKNYYYISLFVSLTFQTFVYILFFRNKFCTSVATATAAVAVAIADDTGFVAKKKYAKKMDAKDQKIY